MWRVSSTLLLVAALGCGALDLVLIHTNDMHSRILEISQGAGTCTKKGTCYGGMARLKKEVDRIRSEHKNVLFLNAGDSFQGTPFYTVHKWKVIARFIDMLGIDAMSLGNHEFDDGVEGLTPYLKAVRTPVVSCNIDTSEEPSFKGANLHPWVNFTVDNTMIAVIGYLTPDTKFLARTENVIMYDEVESITETAKVARQAGAKIVIALGHSGYDVDKKIAAEVADVDIVVGGHTNTFLYTGNPPDKEVPVSPYPHMETQGSGKKVPVVQAFAFTKYLGYLKLNFDDSHRLVSAEGNPILLDSSYPKDEAVATEIEVWKKAVDERTSKVLGKTRVDLQGSCRMGECNMGNFMTDAWIDYAVTASLPREGWTNSPIAILNGGGVRAPIEKNNTKGGEVTVGMVLTSSPFENELFVLEISGSDLLDSIEECVWHYDPTGVIQKGGFLQVSGLKIVYNISAEPGMRVVSAKVRCSNCTVPDYEEIDRSANYSVIVTAFLVDGGDGIYSIKKAYSRTNLGISDSQAVMDYIAKLGTVYPGLEGRVTVIRETGVLLRRSMISHAHSSSPIFASVLLPILLISPLRKWLM